MTKIEIDKRQTTQTTALTMLCTKWDGLYFRIGRRPLPFMKKQQQQLYPNSISGSNAKQHNELNNSNSLNMPIIAPLFSHWIARFEHVQKMQKKKEKNKNQNHFQIWKWVKNFWHIWFRSNALATHLLWIMMWLQLF